MIDYEKSNIIITLTYSILSGKTSWPKYLSIHKRDSLYVCNIDSYSVKFSVLDCNITK